jgi:hypothetical protein
MPKENQPLVPPEFHANLEGRQLIWGMVPVQAFSLLIGNGIPVKLTEKGTDFFDAEELATLNPENLKKIPGLIKYPLEELSVALIVLAQLEEYAPEQLDRSMLEAGAVKSLAGKWLFYDKYVGSKINGTFLGKVHRACSDVKEQLGRDITVQLGLTLYINAQELAQLSWRFFERNLFTEESFKAQQVLLLSLIGEDQLKRKKLRAFCAQKDTFIAKTEGFEANVIYKARIAAWKEVGSIVNQLSKTDILELKLIHLRTFIARHTTEESQAVMPKKVAFHSFVLFELAGIAEYLLLQLSQKES